MSGPIDWKSAHAGITLLMDASLAEVDAAEARRRLLILQLEVQIRLSALDVLDKLGLDPCGDELSKLDLEAEEGSAT